MKSKKKILIIDDDQSLQRIIEYNLNAAGYVTRIASSGEEGIGMFKDEHFDLVISDMTMKDVDGMQVLSEVKSLSPTTTFIIITAYATVEKAVNAMKKGCYDYLIKPFAREELLLTVEKAFKLKDLEDENIMLRKELDNRFKRGNIIGVSSRMQDVFTLVEKVAKSDISVLITGESGTGKELIAKMIYRNSVRSDEKFITVNCAAIPDNLVESELFGYVKGAFSGAIADKPGKFELADGGTIFLDEIGELKPDMQVKLLRVLQEREFDRLGDTKTKTVDVRIICATNAKLDEMVRSGGFREDLFYRINAVTIDLPALRKRSEDVEPFISHFLKKLNRSSVKFDREVLKVLKSYSWPGNVRELENIIESLVLLSDNDVITMKQLPERFKSDSVTFGKVKMEIDEAGINLEEVERELIVFALNKHNNNKSKAARFLGISRPTLLYRLEKYDLV